ncbi:MAG: S-layer homology domain-containing protein [Clostridia bacterium]|nr:S-layer homology domain-containing protein [Clostridia bacterium]
MKRIISLILSIVMIAGSFCVTAVAMENTNNDITVYLTISKYGEIVSDKNGTPVAMSPILLSGKDGYALDDVFGAAHNSLCEAGTSGYETATGDYGLYVSKFWEDTSGNFTYQVNFGEEDVWGPTHEVENGDYIEFCINKSFYPDTEVYTRFDKRRVEVQPGESAELILSQAEYMAEGLTFSACADAVITINGAQTENVTDEEGKGSICFAECGKYIVSAAKTKTVNEETVPAIAAPVCVVEVKNTEAPPADTPDDPLQDEKGDNADGVSAEEQIHNIVEKYLDDSIVNDGNMYWFVADFADYLKVYPESQYVLTNTQKQKCVDKIIEFADEASSQGDLSKAVIALRALGYDAKNTYRKNGTAFDIVAKLTSLVTEESVSAPYYEYTLPYVLIALEQGENYASQETIDFLISTAEAKKASWQDTTWGIDGAAPMLRALASYCSTNEIARALVVDTTELIKAFQGSGGSVGNAASTGLAMMGLSAVGTNPELIIKDGKSLIDGLMNQSNETFDGFLPEENSFSTEQGLRGLISWKLYGLGKMTYDFKDYPKNEARATRKVVSGSSGGGGGSSIVKEDDKEKDDTKKETEVIEEKPQGLSDKSEDVKILPIIFEEKTFEDIKQHKNQNCIEQLALRGIINGKNEKSYCPDETMTRAEFSTIVVRALGVPQKDGKAFKDVADNDWFNVYVNTAYSYGIVNGVSETEFNPNGEITREEAATMFLRAAKLCGMRVDLGETEVRNSLAEFSDYTKASDWAMTGLAFCYNESILDKSVIEVKPNAKITRAEVAEMLYNMLDRVKLI